jgi:hypothetical protein
VAVLPELDPIDLVVRVLPVAYDRPFDVLRAELLHALRKLAR